LQSGHIAATGRVSAAQPLASPVPPSSRFSQSRPKGIAAGQNASWMEFWHTVVETDFL
jgi:hypothetical protein